eukprot:1141660-Pelagomonas_calceolata.AAC.2
MKPSNAHQIPCRAFHAKFGQEVPRQRVQAWVGGASAAGAGAGAGAGMMPPGTWNVGTPGRIN